MSEFTYETPEPIAYLKAVRLLLTRKYPEMKNIADVLARSSCSIQSSSNYSRVRWNGLATTVYLYVPVEALDLFESIGVIAALSDVCDTAMPKDAGLDVLGIEVSPSLEELTTQGDQVAGTVPPSLPLQDPGKVFIVHGRDLKLLDNLGDLLRSVGLTPLSWEEARSLTGKPTPFTEEVVTTAFSKAQAIIILISPDERVQLRNELAADGNADIGHQPRPNVIWEMGLAMAMHHERTILLEVGAVRTLSDLAGRNVIRLDERQGINTDKRKLLLSALRTAGCTVNMGDATWVSTPALYPAGAVQAPPAF
jgi:predicted nucleotide-binding protein